jgi:hypothetical protein
MGIQFEHAMDVAQTPERAFAMLDDLSKTPSWLERCTGIEKLSPGPNAVGTKLRYAYRDAGRSGTMDGEITARVPNERLTFRYSDKMMDVTVDFRVAKRDAGARLVHAIEITPKSLPGKLMSPLIRRMLPKQTISAMEKLKSLLEAEKGN